MENESILDTMKQIIVFLGINFLSIWLGIEIGNLFMIFRVSNAILPITVLLSFMIVSLFWDRT
jgi:hypothetical protein